MARNWCWRRESRASIVVSKRVSGYITCTLPVWFHFGHRAKPLKLPWNNNSNELRQATTSRPTRCCRARHLRQGQLWSWTDAAAPREAPLAWRQGLCDIQAGGHGQLMSERLGTSVYTSPFTVSYVLFSQRSPFRWAKSTARNMSPTRHVRYGRQAFVIAGPSAWSILLDPVRNSNSTEAAFRRLLNTLLFARC